MCSARRNDACSRPRQASSGESVWAHPLDAFYRAKVGRPLIPRGGSGVGAGLSHRGESQNGSKGTL